MIYDKGKLLIGDKWGKGWWNEVASKSGKYYTGILTYNYEKRKLYFFDYNRTFEFNIDDILVDIISSGKLDLLQFKEKEGKTFLYCSMAGFIMDTNIETFMRRNLVYIYNTAICRIINSLKKPK
ncbi:hypothetical protein LCGC14_0689400 [marine sediment metagenome]|uniref:Uncharacterized protein n=1 Tax=marine sediment metagenome TaxID=412755 RepID=A0A0F9TTW7_9ZZZZ|nr:hypothetical protein [bacterium]